MQDTLEKVFNLAVEELPLRHFRFIDHECVIYKGFKISLKKGEYNWEDVRYSNFYEKVDPLITENILKLGFSLTLTKVMLHKDKDKLLEINREIEKINMEVNYWTKRSTENWNKYKKKETEIKNNTDLSNEIIDKILESISNKYHKDKELFKKKRRVLKQEREEMMANFIFYESRIKIYNN